MTDRARPAPATRSAARASSAMVVYLLLLVALQIFLLVVAVEGLQAGEPTLARNAALLSVALFGSTLALRWFVGDH